MASLTQWTWAWANSRRWWGAEKPGVLQFMGSQRVGHDWVTELNWTISLSLVFWQHFSDSVISFWFFLKSSVILEEPHACYELCDLEHNTDLATEQQRPLQRLSTSSKRVTNSWDHSLRIPHSCIFLSFPPEMLPGSQGEGLWRISSCEGMGLEMPRTLENISRTFPRKRLSLQGKGLCHNIILDSYSS